MIDAHCHLNFSYTIQTIKPVIEKFTAMQGKYIVDVTTSYDEIERSQALIQAFPSMIYATLGIHPESSDGTTAQHEQTLQDLQRIATVIPQLNNVVGIGETGLDFSHTDKYPQNHKLVIEQQRELFIKHIACAKQYSLPLVIHARGENIADYQAYHAILSILAEENFSLPVYFHSFGGDYELAKKIINDGNYIGINGIITYSNAKNLSDLVTKLPLTQILLETDSPYLIPSNMDRKTLQESRTNEPIGIFFTAKRIATLQQCPVEKVLETTYLATKKIFAKIL